MRILYCLSLSLIFAMALAMSCANEDANPKIECDGTLAVMVESLSQQTTCAPANGSITVSAAGGSMPYQYSLNGGAKQSSTTFNNVSKGKYSIVVFDANDCQAEVLNVEILFPSSTLDFSATTSPETDCLNNTGSILIAASGGTNYTYSKDNGATFQASNLFSSLEPNTYSIVVKNGDGCTVTKSVAVAQGSTGVTYDNTVQAIIQNKCSKCHDSAGPQVDLTVFGSTTSGAKKYAADIKSRTGSGNMPPPSEPDLTANEIKQIACWVNDGALKN